MMALCNECGEELECPICTGAVANEEYQKRRIAEVEDELAVYRQDGAEAISAVLAEVPHALLAQKNKRIAELEGRLKVLRDSVEPNDAGPEYIEMTKDVAYALFSDVDWEAALREGD